MLCSKASLPIPGSFPNKDEVGNAVFRRHINTGIYLVFTAYENLEFKAALRFGIFYSVYSCC